jgi:hypothetical protein
MRGSVRWILAQPTVNCKIAGFSTILALAPGFDHRRIPKPPGLRGRCWAAYAAGVEQYHADLRRAEKTY